MIWILINFIGDIMIFHTFLLVFIAEMADKTQLMTMALCNRYSTKTVIMGIGLGILCISGVSVLAGDVIGDVIPIVAVKITAAIMFLCFGLWNLRDDNKEEEGSTFSLRIPIISIALTFMLAELGDKTQLATVALAADHMEDHIQVFLGASLGLFCANLVGIFAGKLIFSHVSETTVKVASSFFFFLFGSITLFEAIPVDFYVIVMYSILLIGCGYAIFMHSRKSSS